MRTIVLAGSKGGVGKTTLAAALAAHAAEGDRVAIADVDPQHSLARWLQLRRHFVPQLKSPDLLEGFESVAAAHEEAGKRGYAWLFIDTPPALISAIYPAIEIADFVLIPSKPSPLDLEAIDPVIDMCRDHGKPFLFVITMALQAGALTDSARTYLAHEGPVSETLIGERLAYPAAMIKGCTAAETIPQPGDTLSATTGPRVPPDFDSALEIRRLWQEVTHHIAQAEARAEAEAEARGRTEKDPA